MTLSQQQKARARRDALSVPCSVCGMVRNDPCKATTGAWLAIPHAERIVDAFRAMHADASDARLVAMLRALDQSGPVRPEYRQYGGQFGMDPIDD